MPGNQSTPLAGDTTEMVAAAGVMVNKLSEISPLQLLLISVTRTKAVEQGVLGTNQLYELNEVVPIVVQVIPALVE